MKRLGLLSALALAFALSNGHAQASDRCGSLAAEADALFTQGGISEVPAILYHQALDKIRSFKAAGCEKSDAVDATRVALEYDKMVAGLSECSAVFVETSERDLDFGHLQSAAQGFLIAATINPEDRRSRDRVEGLFGLFNLRVPRTLLRWGTLHYLRDPPLSFRFRFTRYGTTYLKGLDERDAFEDMDGSCVNHGPQRTGSYLEVR